MDKNGDSWCTAEYMGIHAANRATRFEALEPIRLGVRASRLIFCIMRNRNCD